MEKLCNINPKRPELPKPQKNPPNFYFPQPCLHHKHPFISHLLHTYNINHVPVFYCLKFMSLLATYLLFRCRFDDLHMILVIVQCFCADEFCDRRIHTHHVWPYCACVNNFWWANRPMKINECHHTKN